MSDKISMSGHPLLSQKKNKPSHQKLPISTILMVLIHALDLFILPENRKLPGEMATTVDGLSHPNVDG